MFSIAQSCGEWSVSLMFGPNGVFVKLIKLSTFKIWKIPYKSLQVLVLLRKKKVNRRARMGPCFHSVIAGELGRGPSDSCALCRPLATCLTPGRLCAAKRSAGPSALWSRASKAVLIWGTLPDRKWGTGSTCVSRKTRYLRMSSRARPLPPQHSSHRVNSTA